MQDGTVTYKVTYNTTNVDSALPGVAQYVIGLISILNHMRITWLARCRLHPSSSWYRRVTPDAVVTLSIPPMYFLFSSSLLFWSPDFSSFFILSLSERWLLWWRLDGCPSYPPPFLITESSSIFKTAAYQLASKVCEYHREYINFFMCCIDE